MTRRLRIWRVPAVLLAVIVATGVVIPPGPGLAVGPGTMTKVSDTYYRDPACGGTDPFVVDVWTDAGYQGTRFRFCSAYSDFCWVPFGNDSSSSLLCESIGLDGGTANDRVSSIKVVEVNGGSSCRVQLYEHANYGGVAWTAWDPKNDSDLGPVWPNDVFSSIRRSC